jgi:hypothetical protein
MLKRLIYWGHVAEPHRPVSNVRDGRTTDDSSSIDEQEVIAHLGRKLLVAWEAPPMVVFNHARTHVPNGSYRGVDDECHQALM